ncbi:MAG TPA: hypothetical protein VFG36_03075 [Methanoregula sp.]|nr:hypothetical protein [Methanoregula sp.]
MPELHASRLLLWWLQGIDVHKEKEFSFDEEQCAGASLDFNIKEKRIV